MAELGQGGAEAAGPKITCCWPACRKNSYPQVFQSGEIRVLKVMPGLFGLLTVSVHIKMPVGKHSIPCRLPAAWDEKVHPVRIFCFWRQAWLTLVFKINVFQNTDI